VVQTYIDEEDAIRIANSTPFGLSAAVYTADLERALAVAEFLEPQHIRWKVPG
jgi:acyl-CoA reductase-like NAD-dependent aldehyde dehydrogenase